MNEWVLSNGGMILTGENWITGRGILYSVCGRWMNEYWAMVEWYWQGKTELLGEEYYTACVVDEWMSMEQWWNDTDRENWSTERGTWTNITLSTTNPTLPVPGLNMGLHGQGPIKPGQSLEKFTELYRMNMSCRVVSCRVVLCWVLPFRVVSCRMHFRHII
jgi:hypothetical protein